MSKSNVPEMEDYIRNQEEHHRKFNYQEELVALLRNHGIEMTSAIFGINAQLCRPLRGLAVPFEPVTHSWRYGLHV